MSTSQIQLKDVAREIMDRADRSLVSTEHLPQVVDDYFVERLKQDEMKYALIDAKPYDQLRTLVKARVLPLYQEYRSLVERMRQRQDGRKPGYYVLGTIAFLQVLEAYLTKGRSFAPQVFIPTAIIQGFIGFFLYAATRYLEERRITRARKQLEKSIEGLDHSLLTDIEYDNRRALLETEVLPAEAAEILVAYPDPDIFWRDYIRVREADPANPAEVPQLNAPAFEKFLSGHVQGQYSPAARQHRFNRLFIEAHDIFIGRDRETYVTNHLKQRK
jgi:hypothetical protein